MNKYSYFRFDEALSEGETRRREAFSGGDRADQDSPDQDTLKEDVLPERAAEELAEMFRALSDPSRIRIISALFSAEMSVGALAERVKMSESAVSHQLRGLRHMGLVRARKEGRQVYYALADDHIAQLYSLGLSHLLHG